MTLDCKIEQVIAVLAQAASEFAPVGFANSLGAEDMVLTDLIAKHQPDIAIFSLDTGRLPQETYDLMQEVRRYYGIPLTVYFPDSKLVEDYVAQHGINGFYDSIENRKGCCFVRKVEPLRRALRGKGAWITGMRRDQAVTRGTLELSAYDTDNGLQKFNPLLEWSNRDVWAYIRRHDVPYNKLHDQFYPSLGCAPCTRSVTPGEDIRAGRWWWENPETKECGLHASHSPKGDVAHGFGVSAKGNVGSEAHDVSSSHDSMSKECGLHASHAVAHGAGVQPMKSLSPQASRGRIDGIAVQTDSIQEVPV
jgi:phosphoadenosine phosphosulfate reductase